MADDVQAATEKAAETPTETVSLSVEMATEAVEALSDYYYITWGMLERATAMGDVRATAYIVDNIGGTNKIIEALCAQHPAVQAALDTHRREHDEAVL